MSKLHSPIYLALALLSLGCQDNEAVGRAIEKSGNILITAIEQYKANAGAYPDTLQQLVLSHGIDTHAPSEGSWVYRRVGDTFELSFQASSEHGISGFWINDQKVWGIDTK